MGFTGRILAYMVFKLFVVGIIILVAKCNDLFLLLFPGRNKPYLYRWQNERVGQCIKNDNLLIRVRLDWIGLKRFFVQNNIFFLNISVSKWLQNLNFLIKKLFSPYHDLEIFMH